MQNQVVWVDIPVTNLARAMAFYSAVLGSPVTKQSGQGFEFGLLPHEKDNTSGCLVQDDDNHPSQAGPLVYLNVSGRLDAAIAAVEPAGGSVAEPKHAIGPHGFRAIIVDSEGNRIALHSPTG